MKILTTAFFSVLILKRNLSKLKWIALALLTVGIALVVLPKGASTAFIAYITGDSLVTEDTPTTTTAPITGNQSNLQGFIAVLSACMLSGLAGVYFEKILKSPTPKAPVPVHHSQSENAASEDYEDQMDNLGESQEEEESKNMIAQKEDMTKEEEKLAASNQIWIRNIQMSFFSVLLGLIFVVMLQDGVTIVTKGFFVNYTYLTWVVILIQALGGLIVALVVKYADNILKGFATSISIILSSIVSVWLFNFTFSGSFLLGAALVIYATYLYGL